jgi:hypothetical protein
MSDIPAAVERLIEYVGLLLDEAHECPVPANAPECGPQTCTQCRRDTLRDVYRKAVEEVREYTCATLPREG